MIPRIRSASLAIVLASLATLSHAADTPALHPSAVDLDPAAVYRYDPLGQTFSPIDAAQLKIGHIYYRFHPTLGHWAWSLADGHGGLNYAMGPGSLLQVERFDLTATADERRRELTVRAPEIARLFNVQGSRPAVMLQADGTWTLHGTSTKGHVFDLVTGERWEWHGDRRSGVVHSGGNAWHNVGGRFEPAWTISTWCF